MLLWIFSIFVVLGSLVSLGWNIRNSVTFPYIYGTFLAWTTCSCGPLHTTFYDHWMNLHYASLLYTRLTRFPLHSPYLLLRLISGDHSTASDGGTIHHLQQQHHPPLPFPPCHENAKIKSKTDSITYNKNQRLKLQHWSHQIQATKYSNENSSSAFDTKFSQQTQNNLTEDFRIKVKNKTQKWKEKKVVNFVKWASMNWFLKLHCLGVESSLWTTNREQDHGFWLKSQTRSGCFFRRKPDLEGDLSKECPGSRNFTGDGTGLARMRMRRQQRGVIWIYAEPVDWWCKGFGKKRWREHGGGCGIGNAMAATES